MSITQLFFGSAWESIIGILMCNTSWPTHPSLWPFPMMWALSLRTSQLLRFELHAWHEIRLLLYFWEKIAIHTICRNNFNFGDVRAGTELQHELLRVRTGRRPESAVVPRGKQLNVNKIVNREMRHSRVKNMLWLMPLIKWRGSRDPRRWFLS